VKNIGFWHPIFGLSEKNIFHPLIQREIFAVCRSVYEAGFNPICPILFMPLFLNNAIPAEHKNNIDIKSKRFMESLNPEKYIEMLLEV